MKNNPAITTIFVWLIGMLMVLLMCSTNKEENMDRIKQLQADSTRLHGMILKCNGVISRSNEDSSFYIKNNKND